MKHFKENNVHTEHAKVLDNVGSGQAYILSLANGNNAIVIVGGSNEEYDPNMTELDPNWAATIRKCNSKLVKFIITAKILLLQREIPEFVNVIAARVAKESGTMVILDVGGRDEPFTPELFQYIDILSPNETELIRVLGKKPKDEEDHDHEIDLFLR